MTTEELLQPRFKVIADFPGSNFGIGEILDEKWVGEFFNELQYFPHLFRKLEWFEDREIENLPKYLKFNEEDYQEFSINGDKQPFVHKVLVHFRYSTNKDFRYSCNKRFVSQWKEQEFNYNQFQPATKEEYEANNNI